MKVIFTGGAARAVGLQETALGLQTTLTVREVLAILASLYPGFGDVSPRHPAQGLRVCLNDSLADLDAQVKDGDQLEISATDHV